MSVELWVLFIGLASWNFTATSCSSCENAHRHGDAVGRGRDRADMHHDPAIKMHSAQANSEPPHRSGLVDVSSRG